MSLAIAFSLTACGGTVVDDNGGGGGDAKNKTQLFIMNYDGGYGTDWLYDAIKRFEAQNADVSFEDGKVGCKITVDPRKAGGSEFTFSTTNVHMAITEQNTLSAIGSSAMEPLDDVMDAILAQDGVDLPDNILNALKLGDGHVYAIPHYEGGGGITYDKDLFNRKKLYIAKDGGYVSASGNLSAGPDGIEGTFDDGLPATYKEFLDLCDYMKTKNIVPFIISGVYKGWYCSFVLDRFAASYNGENYKANYTFSGTNVPYVVSATEDDSLFGYSFTTATTDIDSSNAYLLRQTKGNFCALSILNEIVKNKYYDTKGWGSSVTHLDAQERYLRSYKGETGEKPIAMLIDGTWWQNEARETFESMAYENEYDSAANRNFGWMPLPTKIDENDTNEGDPLLTVDHLNALVFLRKDCADGTKKLAKEFIKFLYTPENLELFTKQTGTTRPFKYEISENTYNGLSSFEKDIWNMHNNDKFVYVHSANKQYMARQGSWFSQRWQTPNESQPLTSFNSGTMTPYEYFTKMWINSTDW
ncbi:MAG: carbohydrate ABC transporter substrate-binding protein [Clostridia bacterium]|nr:carbohydrate ABC transporter substrate-binding protein [Clostridia bacterium]